MKALPHPNELRIEVMVLGTLIQSRPGLVTALPYLKRIEVFYKPAHQQIYRAILSLYRKGESVDILTVTQELREIGKIDFVGGPNYVVSLTQNAYSDANLLHHIHILLEYYARREVMNLFLQGYQGAGDQSNDILELISKNVSNLSALLGGITANSAVTAAQVYDDFIATTQANIEKLGLVGVPSGISSIDRLTGGWHKGNLIIIAARPGMGKTALGLQCAKNAVLQYGKRVVFFSLEMSNEQLIGRLIASESEFTNSQFIKGLLTTDDLEEVVIMSQKLRNNNMFLDDTAGLTITDFKTKCLKLKTDYDIDLIIVDYLQLMRGERDGNREQEISSISRGLKLTAKELSIPIIAFSQLSRAVESRPDKKPQLSDLRESGSIEQDADMVVFLYRPEYYGITQDEIGNSTVGTLQHIFAKHRNGPLDTIITRCDLAHSSITDYADQY